MSDFMDMFVEMLPMASNLQNKNNEVRKVLDYTIGEYMENISDIGDELFLTSATGGWLDAWGRDYGVIRRVDESDDSFRERIIFEKLEYLTAHNLQSIYGVQLFSAFDGFYAEDNDLTSDNPYLTDWFMGVAPLDTQKILNSKFILGGSIIWYNNEELDSIYNTSNVGVLKNYIGVYDLTDITQYFYNITTIKKVDLHLSVATNGSELFKGCTGLTEASLNSSSLNNIYSLFEGCTNLTKPVLTLPNVIIANQCFYGCTSLNNVSNLDFPNVKYANSIFRGCTGLTSHIISLLKAEAIQNGFRDCTGLISITLNIPKATNVKYLFGNCSSLAKVKLDMSGMTGDWSTMDIFHNCSALNRIEVTVPSANANAFKSYVLGLNLSNLTYLKINGSVVNL